MPAAPTGAARQPPGRSARCARSRPVDVVRPEVPRAPRHQRSERQRAFEDEALLVVASASDAHVNDRVALPTADDLCGQLALREVAESEALERVANNLRIGEPSPHRKRVRICGPECGCERDDSGGQPAESPDPRGGRSSVIAQSRYFQSSDAPSRRRTRAAARISGASSRALIPMRSRAGPSAATSAS